LCFASATYASAPGLHPSGSEQGEIVIDRLTGQHVNPSTVKTVASDKLGGPDLKAFKAQVASIQNQRRDLINRAEIADQSGGNPVLDCNRQRGCAN
jgi:hypothetical protein